MNPFIEDIKKQYQNGSALIKLIIVNIVVFVTIHLIGLVLFLFEFKGGTSVVIYWLSLPAYLGSIIYKPWTVLTYMFSHEEIGHIFFNLLILYLGGRIFSQYLSDKKLVITYLLGGLAGGFLMILFLNIFPVFDEVKSIAIAFGASASVIAVLIAAATYVPDYAVRLIFLGSIKLKYIALVLLIMDLVNIPQENAGGHIAHLGGAIFGFFYIQQLKKGNDFTLGFSRFLDYLKELFKPQKKMKVVYKKQGKTKTNDAYNSQKVENQKKVDIILDKISKSGYDSLSADEKAILFDASKK